MPKIDYSKTQIYKLQCKLDAVKDVFFGHCTHMINAKYYLKNDIAKGKDTAVCNTIRENGGLSNWDMIVIEQFTGCCNKRQADYRVNVIRKEYSHKISQTKSEIIPNNPEIIPLTQTTPELIQNADVIRCEQCSKIFTLNTNLIRHQKKSCKNISQNTVKTLQDQINLQQKELCKQMEKIQQLENKTNQTSSVNIGTQNNIQNNNIIFELGEESFEKILTTKQKLQILNKKYMSIDFFIQKYHCNLEYPQFQNVKITSLTKSHCDVYSKKDNMFVVKNTNDTVEQLMDSRMGDLHIILDETPNVPENTDKAVRGLFEKMQTDEEYKREKCNSIKMKMYSEYRNKMR